jgi:hypothetical protein
MDRIGIRIILVAAKEPSGKDGIIENAYYTEAEAPPGTDRSVSKETIPFSTGGILIQSNLHVMEIVIRG